MLQKSFINDNYNIYGIRSQKIFLKTNRNVYTISHIRQKGRKLLRFTRNGDIANIKTSILFPRISITDHIIRRQRNSQGFHFRIISITEAQSMKENINIELKETYKSIKHRIQ